MTTSVTEAPLHIDPRVPAGPGLFPSPWAGSRSQPRVRDDGPPAGHRRRLSARRSRPPGISSRSTPWGVVVGAPLFAVVGARLPRKALLLFMGGVAVANLDAARTGSPAGAPRSSWSR